MHFAAKKDYLKIFILFDLTVFTKCELDELKLFASAFDY